MTAKGTTSFYARWSVPSTNSTTMPLSKPWDSTQAHMSEFAAETLSPLSAGRAPARRARSDTLTRKDMLRVNAEWEEAKRGYQYFCRGICIVFVVLILVPLHRCISL